jgi:parvulin-like peptidyl-prolyl isomerase
MLDKHLKKRHPQNAAALSGAQMEFGAMLLIHCYKIDDGTVTARADLIRDSFVNQFAPNVSDAEIDALIDRIMEGNQSGEKILHREQAQQLARALRDLLTCRGQYALKTSAPPEAPALIHP